MRDMRNRRLKIIHLNPQMLFEILVKHPNEFTSKILIPNIPDDLTLYGANYSDERQSIMLCVHSDSFEEVPLGQVIPELRPIYKKHEEPD
jgi:hypothetical protein